MMTRIPLARSVSGSKPKQFHPLRVSQTNKSRKFSTKTKIPEPTWSLNDLNLGGNGRRVSDEELDRLGKRCLIDVNKFEDKESLKEDLSKMLVCLEELQSVELPDLNDAAIYDVPRGVTAAPIGDADDRKHKEEAKSVWHNMLQPNTTLRGGSHEYFSIVTKSDSRAS